MGLFDFLKGKPKPAAATGEAQSMQGALDALGDKLGGQSRYWHYFIGHVALRDFALRGEGLPRRGAEPAEARRLFAMILGKMAPHLGIDAADAERLAQGFVIHHRQIGGREVAIVEMPPPQGPTECHFVALVPAHGASPARFFTLEDARGGVTMFGGWDAEEQHLNLGVGPPPTLDAFADAVAAQL